MGGDGRFRAQPYVTVDLTRFLPAAGGPTLLALQTMEFGGFQPCKPHSECNGASQVSVGPAVLMQIDVHPTGGGAPTSWVTDWAENSRAGSAACAFADLQQEEVTHASTGGGGDCAPRLWIEVRESSPKHNSEPR